MAQVNIHAAKTQLSKLLERVAAGEEIVIAKAGKPVAKLVPYAAATAAPVLSPAKQRLGALKGKIWMAPDFDEPLEEFFPYMYDSEDEWPKKPAGLEPDAPTKTVDWVAEE